MSAVVIFLKWVFLWVALGMDWLARSALAPLVALVLIGVSALWIWAVEATLRGHVSERTGLPRSALGFGPAHASAGTIVLWIGVGHLLLNLACWALSGTARYGPEGMVFGAVGADSMIPLPYMAALPLALCVYGYMYSVVLYGRILALCGARGSASAVLEAVFVVPFIWIALPISLFKGRRKPAKKEGSEAEKTEATDIDPGEPRMMAAFDNPRWLLLEGHGAAQVDGLPTRRAFQVFPRYLPLVRPYAPWILVILAVSLLVPFFLDHSRSATSLPVGLAEYADTLDGLGAPAAPRALLPEPFRDAAPEATKGLTIEDPLRSPKYACDTQTLGTLERLADTEPNEDTSARLRLNAALCREGTSSLSWRSWKEYFDRAEELERVRQAAERLAGTDDAARAWLIAGIAYGKPGFEHEAAQLLASAAEAAEASDSALVLAVTRHADLLLDLNRFDDALDLLRSAADRAARTAEDGPAHEALATLLRLNQALALEAAYRPADGKELLATTRERIGGTAALRPLAEAVAHEERRLGPDPSNTHLRAHVRLFGPLHAGFLASVVLFLLGLINATRSPRAERPARKAIKKEKAAPPGESAEVDEADILAALETEGFTLAATLELSPGASRGRHGGDLEAEVKKAADSSPAFSDFARAGGGAETAPSGRPVEDFLPSLLADRGAFHDHRGLYAHQARALEYVRSAWSTPGEPTTVLLSTARGSGRTTAALFAAVEALVLRGMSVLYVGHGRQHVDALYAFFEKTRTSEAWSWNLRAVKGVEGLSRVRRERAPIHLVFVDLDELHHHVLPVEAKAALEPFLSTLGLLVVEDIEAYGPTGAAHASFVMRRLGEMLRAHGVRAVTLATTLPVHAHEDDLARMLLGPLARELRVVPQESDDAEQPEQVAHVLQAPRRRVVGRERGPTVEHAVAATVQARGCGDGGGHRTTWPTALAGYEELAPARDDLAIAVYRRFGVDRLIDLTTSDASRAIVYPLTARSIGRLIAVVRHAGIGARKHSRRTVRDELRFEDEDGVDESTEEPSGEARRRRHSVFLVCGPEPIDLYLGDLFAGAALGGVAEIAAVHRVLSTLVPEGALPRRNRGMNQLHFEATMQEREPPGHSRSYLDDTFEPDVLRDLLSALERTGRLDRTYLPRIDPRRMEFTLDERIWAPRSTRSSAELQVATYSPDILRVQDRVTDRQVAVVEAVRADALFHPGRAFVVAGERFTVLAPRFQTAKARGVLLCEPLPTDHRTSPVRTVSYVPRGGLPLAISHRMGRGAEMFVAFTDIDYRESVVGVRRFPSLECEPDSLERFEAHDVRFETEGLLLGFGSEAMGGVSDPDACRRVLFATVLLLRQALPIVLHAALDDVELAFGAGSGPASAEIGARSNAVFRTPIGGAIDLPWIGFFDRMAGGLGYARLLQQRLFHGELFRDLCRQALDLVDWAERGGRAGLATDTSLVREEEGPSSADAAGARDLLRRLLAAPESEPELPLDILDDTREPRSADDEGVAARRGLLDLFGLAAADAAVGERLLPEWDPEGDEPWGLALLCVLHAVVSDAALRCKVERATMALLALHRRSTGEDDMAPPVGRRELGRYKPDAATAGDLRAVPELAPAGGLALEVSYGRLARAGGLMTERGELTERGCVLAQALLTAPGFREAFDAIVAAARDDRLP